ncbi:MAG TPA: hypothetical protein VKO18_19085 [Terriglobia bacterium]|nr:hypothetical protein [Terriglobia bacterium]
MWKYTIAVVLFFFSAVTVYRAQYGSAGEGYYPHNYYGQTFNGAVTSTNDATREVSLSFTNPKDGKTQTFVGVLTEGYSVELKEDGSLHELKPSQLRLGGYFKVYYMPTTRKVGGKKTTINIIFLIGGIPDARAHYLYFKSFTSRDPSAKY